MRVGRLSQHQLDGTRRSVHACTRLRARVCRMHRCTGVGSRPLCSIGSVGSQRWPSTRPRPGENGKNPGPDRDQKGQVSRGGPRQLTTAGRKSFYVFISSWLPSFLSTFQRADRRRNNAHSTPRSASSPDR